MTLSLRLSYASIGLSSSDSCHFETREVTPSENDTFTAIKLCEYWSGLLGVLSKRLFRESQNDTFTAIKLCEYWSGLLGVLSF